MAGASSSSGGSWRYDVFINFRGEDTRRSFVCHLYDALIQKALDTFIDSEELRKGDDLSELLRAIQDSRLSIVVFSKSYASSTWCLKELVQILECMDRHKQIVVPIFYEVDPSHVRKLKNGFAEAFAKHENDSNVGNEELESWKSSLTRTTNLSGYDSRNCQDDIQLIKSIVEDVLKKLIRIPPSVTDGLIGMDSHMVKIDSLLELVVCDFRIVGIWGMGGIGKSTIARAVYDKIGAQFEHKCFLDNVKEGFLTKNGGVQMLEELLSRILNVNDRRTLDGGLNIMRKKLGKKKILLVLDDVDDLYQIETLIGNRPSFGGGSRVIITTRDKRLLPDEDFIYEPQLLTTDKSLELFCWYAFRTDRHSDIYDPISKRVVEYAHGLPLALRVLGSLLHKKNVQQWEYELEKIKKIPMTDIGRVLRASYDGLDECQQNILLDIGCFFRGEQKDFVTEFHESCGFFPHNGLTVLIERSLVGVSILDRLHMHDLIQEMCRDIVRQESTEDPGKRSRLWYHEDVVKVLAQNTGLEAVQGIVLDLSKLNEIWVNNEAFVGMKRLRILQLGVSKDLYGASTYNGNFKQYVSGDLKFHSNELRVLVWHGYPLKSLPSEFSTKNLIKIDMRHSHIKQLWEGRKALQNLVYMDLMYSKDLIRTPDFTEAIKVERLDLADCTSLLEIDPSISALKSLVYLILEGCSNLEKFPNVTGNMKKLKGLYLGETAIREMPPSANDLPGLVALSLRGCRELRSLPSSIHMKSLECLDLSGCSKLAKFPEISEVMEKLRELYLDGTAIEELPSSIDNLINLRKLSMRNCTGLVCLPDEICNLAGYEGFHLDLTGCSNMEKFPDNIKSFMTLNTVGSGIKQLPFSILRTEEISFQGLKELTVPFSSWPMWNHQNPSYCVLRWLNLSDCNLLEISYAIAHLSSLQDLNLSGNKNLESLPAAMNRLGRLKNLYVQRCNRLKSIPGLSSILHIQADDCTSLETVSTPQHTCADWIRLRFVNCLKLEKTNLFIDIVETALGYQGDGVFQYVSRYYMCVPGSDIPDWFNHQCRGSSITVQLPPDWFANKFQGLAICAISNLRGAQTRKTLESAFCCATFKANDGQANLYFTLTPITGGINILLKSDHMFLGYRNSSRLAKWHNERMYTEATFRMVTTSYPKARDYGFFLGDSMTWEDCTWITSCGVRLLPMNPPASVDLIRNLENRETEMRSKRKGETLERGK